MLDDYKKDEPKIEEEIQKIEKENKIYKNFKVEDLIAITGALDFQDGRAFIAVPVQELIKDRVETQLYLITSEREKLLFDNRQLLVHKLYADRQPVLIPRWQSADWDKFLQGAVADSLLNTYEKIVKQLELYLDCGNFVWLKVLAVWIIGTYFHRLFPTYPYLHLNGNMGSGKTKCLTIIAALSFNGELSINNTPAYMIRVIHNNSATCCIDEVEKLNHAKDEDSKTVLAMLNAGYKRGSFSGKAEQIGQGKNWTTRRFEAYSPKVLAGIQNLNSTLNSRCLPIVMVKSNNRAIVNSEVNEQDLVWTEIRNELHRAALTFYKGITSHYTCLIDDELLGRPWELWKPIFAIAQTIGQELYLEIRNFALEIERQKKEVENDTLTAPVLLEALKDLLSQNKVDEGWYPTAEIYKHLESYDEETFGWLKDDKNKSKRGKWLGSELRRAGIVKGKAQQKKVEGANTKGYCFKATDIGERLKSFGLYQEPDKNLGQADEKVPDIPF